MVTNVKMLVKPFLKFHNGKDCRRRNGLTLFAILPVGSFSFPEQIGSQR